MSLVWSKAQRKSVASTLLAPKPARQKTSARCCLPWSTMCASFWSSSPTASTICARSDTSIPSGSSASARETLDITRRSANPPWHGLGFGGELEDLASATSNLNFPRHPEKNLHQAESVRQIPTRAEGTSAPRWSRAGFPPRFRRAFKRLYSLHLKVQKQQRNTRPGVRLACRPRDHRIR